MKKPFLIGTSLFMVVLIAFVYFSQPIKAKADQPALNYQTTNDDLATVKAQITGMEIALVPIVFIIIGFLALTYCTLRNVNVPLSYPSNTSFIDKCSSLGHYCFDYATDALKDVLYSVAQFVASGQVVDANRISSTLPFLIKSVGKFFSAFGIWLSSSFVSNIKPIAEGLLDNFKPQYFTSLILNPNVGALQTTFDLYSAVPLFNTLSFQYAWRNSSTSYEFYSSGITKHVGVDFSQYCVMLNDIGFVVGTVSDGFFTSTGDYLFDIYSSWIYSYSNLFDFPYPSLSTYNNVVWNNSTSTISAYGCRFTLSPYSVLIDNGGNYLRLSQDILSFINSLGFNAVYQTTGTDTQYHIAVDDVTVITSDPVTNAFSDTVYTPTADEMGADIDDVADELGTAAGVGSLAALIALLTQDQALTLGTAISDVQTINSAGDYNFPSMDNIWKYPQYFFDMLHQWGVFVKGCLNSVTVGEGGLSWIFYGGFVILICGGIIGKILLG